MAIPRCVNLAVFERALQTSRAAVQKTQLCQIPDFIRPDFVTQLLEEAEELREHGFRSHERHNIYLESQPDSGPKGDADESQIRNIAFRSGKVAVGMHRIPPHSALLELYRWEGMTRLMKTAFALPRLHMSTDPAGAPSCTKFFHESHTNTHKTHIDTPHTSHITDHTTHHTQTHTTHHTPHNTPHHTTQHTTHHTTHHHNRHHTPHNTPHTPHNTTTHRHTQHTTHHHTPPHTPPHQPQHTTQHTPHTTQHHHTQTHTTHNTPPHTTQHTTTTDTTHHTTHHTHHTTPPHTDTHNTQHTTTHHTTPPHTDTHNTQHTTTHTHKRNHFMSGAVYYNFFSAGDQLGWHFDNSAYSMNLILQETASLPAITTPAPARDTSAEVQVSDEVRQKYPGGGLFMYWPQSRPRVDQWVRNGRQFPAKELTRATGMAMRGEEEDGEEVHMTVPELTPGSLYLFAGNQSLVRLRIYLLDLANNELTITLSITHCVSPVTTDRAERINAILTYNENPDEMLNTYTRHKFFGDVKV